MHFNFSLHVCVMPNLPAAPVIRITQRFCVFNTDNRIPVRCCSSKDQIKFTFFFFFLIEIIDYLYEKKLPELEEKLREEGNRGSSDNLAASQQQKAFRFSDIFDSSEESD